MFKNLFEIFMNSVLSCAVSIQNFPDISNLVCIMVLLAELEIHKKTVCSDVHSIWTKHCEC